MTHVLFFVAGGVIIAGGITDSGRLSSAEGLGMQGPPAVPAARSSFSLTLMGFTVYLCGGYSPPSADCYSLDTEEPSPTWRQRTGLPQEIWGHTSIRRGTHIWYVHVSTLYDYNTITGTTEQYTMPFTGADGHCAVANATHSYVAGVGSKFNEIWFSSTAGDPSQWTLVTKLPITMHYLSCVWFQDTIYFQGGSDRDWHSLKDAFSLDVNSHSLRRLANMTTARRGARAAILDCKPAVIGGRTSRGEYLTSVETYNGTVWTIHEMSLETPRAWFGLVQFYN